MNYIVILAQYGLSSMRDTISKMGQPVTLIVKRKDGGWASQSKGGTLKSISEPRFTSGDKVVRWGNSLGLSGSFIGYNTPDAVAFSSDKGRFREKMMENEIPIPTPYHKDTKNWPIVVRPLHHHAGQHFHIVKNVNELKAVQAKLGQSYASEVYPKQREVRVHCCSGKVLLIKEKPAPSDKNTIAWNFAINEEAWTTVDRSNYDPMLCKIALDAMSAIKLDIGAVDMMFDPIDKSKAKYVVCEINTAPSLTEYLSTKYAQYFDYIFSKPTKVDNWDYSKLKEGKSFSWKNEQLSGSLT
jgi:hypothetical protein